MESKIKVSEKVFSMCEENKEGRGGNGEVKKCQVKILLEKITFFKLYTSEKLERESNTKTS